MLIRDGSQASLMVSGGASRSFFLFLFLFMFNVYMRASRSSALTEETKGVSSLPVSTLLKYWLCDVHGKPAQLLLALILPRPDGRELSLRRSGSSGERQYKGRCGEHTNGRAGDFNLLCNILVPKTKMSHTYLLLQQLKNFYWLLISTPILILQKARTEYSGIWSLVQLAQSFCEKQK